MLRRYAWLGKDRRQVREEVLPAYMDGLMEHWRESAEDDKEKALFRVSTPGRTSAPRRSPPTGCCGAPGRRHRPGRALPAEHRAAITSTPRSGQDCPAHSGAATMGGYEELREMIRLFGREVISALTKREHTIIRCAPEFTELAEKVNNWGRWGADDERGT